MENNSDKSSKTDMTLDVMLYRGGKSDTNSMEDFVAGLLPNGGSRCGDALLPAASRGGRGDWWEFETIQNIEPSEKGIIDLKTGDSLVRLGGMEILLMKNGGSITVSADGKIKIEGGTTTFDPMTNATTVDFGGGKSATIKDGRIDSVTDILNTSFINRKPNENRRGPHIVCNPGIMHLEHAQPDSVLQQFGRLHLFDENKPQWQGYTPKPNYSQLLENFEASKSRLRE